MRQKGSGGLSLKAKKREMGEWGYHGRLPHPGTEAGESWTVLPTLSVQSSAASAHWPPTVVHRNPNIGHPGSSFAHST